MKYKAHLNLHSGKQELGANYFETYAPVVTGMAICFLLVLAILNRWSMRQIDFVMAYTQAPIECEMYMTIPHGISTWYGRAEDYVLRLIIFMDRNKPVRYLLVIEMKNCGGLILNVLFLMSMVL